LRQVLADAVVTFAENIKAIMRTDLFEELHDGCRLAACGNPNGIENDDYEFGVVRPDGSFVIPPEWSGVCWRSEIDMYETHRYILDGESEGYRTINALFTADGLQLYTGYDSATVLNSKCIAVSKGTRCGVISPDGAEILPIRYDFENDDVEGIALFESGKFTDNAKFSVLLEQVPVRPDGFRLQLSDASTQNGRAELSEALGPEEAAELQRLAEPSFGSAIQSGDNAKSGTGAAFCIESFRMEKPSKWDKKVPMNLKMEKIWLDLVKGGIENEGRAKEYAGFNRFTVMLGVTGFGLRLDCLPAAKELSDWLLKLSPGAQVRFCHRVPANSDAIRRSLTIIDWKQ
jgi:hypothetical protein